MFQVADEMKALGVKFDAVIYSTVIGACADAGESARAFELFEVPLNEYHDPAIAPVVHQRYRFSRYVRDVPPGRPHKRFHGHLPTDRQTIQGTLLVTISEPWSLSLPMTISAAPSLLAFYSCSHE